MSSYLLPCPACGQKLTVSPAQSGQSVLCSCGRSLEVPTLRDLRQLEPATDVDGPQSSWNRRKGLVFLGCIIMAMCAALGGWYVSKLPRGVSPGELRAEIDAMEPSTAFVRFNSWKRGSSNTDPGNKLIQDPVKPLYQGTFEDPHPLGPFIAPNAAYHTIGQAHDVKTRSFWLPVIIGGSIFGLLIALSALLVGDGSSQSQPKRPVAASR